MPLLKGQLSDNGDGEKADDGEFGFAHNGEAFEKGIDRQVRAIGAAPGLQLQNPFRNPQAAIGRDDIDVARLDGSPIRCLEDGHRGCTPQ